ncbi:MAG: YraN family protein [Vibrio sp.]|uniref:YraN family protein n=1 Tax=Vibrio sp. TaxID=678 RepID=UPI003A8C2759
MQNKRSKGQHFEQMAADYLCRHGLIVIEKNFLARGGELDLIMKQRDTLVFVEVKYRNSQAYGHAAECVTRQKQQRLIKTANWWMLKRGLNADTTDFRFDVIAIHGDTVHSDSKHIEWIKNAITEG